MRACFHRHAEQKCFPIPLTDFVLFSFLIRQIFYIKRIEDEKNCARKDTQAAANTNETHESVLRLYIALVKLCILFPSSILCLVFVHFQCVIKQAFLHTHTVRGPIMRINFYLQRIIEAMQISNQRKTFVHFRFLFRHLPFDLVHVSRVNFRSTYQWA